MNLINLNSPLQLSLGKIITETARLLYSQHIFRSSSYLHMLSTREFSGDLRGRLTIVRAYILCASLLFLGDLVKFGAILDATKYRYTPRVSMHDRPETSVKHPTRSRLEHLHLIPVLIKYDQPPTRNNSSFSLRYLITLKIHHLPCS